MNKLKRIFIAAIVAAAFTTSAHTQHEGHGTGDQTSKTGVLLLAHGGKDNWNAEVMKVASAVDKTMPTEVAFGMASKRNIQNAVDKLVARNVEKIIAVPLFISSHSSVITSTEFLLGHRDAAPKELAIYAQMDHGHGGGHQHNSSDEPMDPMTPVKRAVPIQMSSALNRHPLVAEILLSRAAELSREPGSEVVVVVAHGPVSDEDNDRWLADMRSLVGHMRGKSNFKRIEYLTVRDDAPEEIRSRAAEELRTVVKRASNETSRVLIVPLLLAYGGIEEGIKKRLEGLDYQLADQALLPDERLVQWVLLSAGEAIKADQRPLPGKVD